jgi:hypothetical protein
MRVTKGDSYYDECITVINSSRACEEQPNTSRPKLRRGLDHRDERYQPDNLLKDTKDVQPVKG